MSSPLGPLLRKLQSATIGKPKAAPDSVERRQLEAEFQARRQQLEEQMRQRGAELTQREDFLQRVTDTLPGMVAYWNRDGLCEFANAAYGAWFGRSRDEMIGLHARDMLGDEEYARGRPMIETVLAGQSHQIERTLTNQQGEVRHFYSHYVPNWRDGQVHGFFIMQADVTPIKEVELRLRQSNAELMHAEQFARTIAENMPGRVIYWDRNQRCRLLLCRNVIDRIRWALAISLLIGLMSASVCSPGFAVYREPHLQVARAMQRSVQAAQRFGHPTDARSHV